MSPLTAFLERARGRIEHRRALVWAIRGATVAAVAVLLVQLAARRWLAGDTQWPWVAAFVALGAVVAGAGWMADRPSLGAVARIADQSLRAHERLATALELAGRQDEQELPLVQRQRVDTDAWIEGADPDGVARPSVPRFTLALSSVAVAFSALLIILPNPALSRTEAARQAEAGREAAADKIAKEAEKASQAAPGEDGARRQELVRELRRVEESVRDAETTTDAVAELSRAQENLRSQAGPSNASRSSAAAGAGAALAQAAPATQAGAALAEVGSPAAEELKQLAAALPALRPEEQAALAQELAAAAEAATDASAAQDLRQAAEQLARGETSQAQQSLMAAARRQEEQRTGQAAAKLTDLAQALPTLDAQQQAALAQALQQAATAAEADPALAESLRRAAQALQQGRPGEASAALQAAGQRVRALAPESALDGEVASASNELKRAKDALLAEEQGARSQGAGAEQAKGQGDLPGQGEGLGQGQDLQQQGKASGEGSGQGEGPAKGVGSGPGGGSDQHRGGGATGGGAAGSLSQGPPGLPGEQVYVPGISGQGRTQARPGEGSGSGTESTPIPYENVYGEYRDEALSQADRQLIPERLQELLRNYFQESPP